MFAGKWRSWDFNENQLQRMRRVSAENEHEYLK